MTLALAALALACALCALALGIAACRRPVFLRIEYPASSSTAPSLVEESRPSPSVQPGLYRASAEKLEEILAAKAGPDG